MSAGTKGVPRSVREVQLLDVASEQIALAGYAGLSPARVAAAAGVSKPMVYLYFGSKDGLYAACVERAAATVCDAIDSVVYEPARLEIMGETLQAIFGALGERRFDWNVLFDTTHPAAGPVAEIAVQARTRLAAQAARGTEAVLGVRGVVDPVDLSAFTEVWMATVAALVNWWFRHPDESAEAMTARARRLIGELLGVGSQ
ncbi:TetR family transcriptional regulator [Mycolicibacterium llatzerense]|nr:TetR family transcriptional regulator [Mycolicibacterium llatzerense]